MTHLDEDVASSLTYQPTPDDEEQRSNEFRVSFLSLLVALAVVVRALLSLLPIRDLVVYVTPDDSYYYFTIARNVSAGMGVAFDGETSTNGFHPLWLTLTGATYVLPVPDELSLRLALFASAIISGTGTIAVHRCATVLTGRNGLALLAASIFAVHPAVVLASVNGLETGLLLALTLWTLERLLTLTGAREAATRWTIASSGLASGLLLLTRTDYVIVLAPMLVAAAVIVGWRPIAVVTASAATIVFPWFIWSFIATGSFVQTSSRAVPYVAHANGAEGFSAWRHGIDLTWRAWTQQVPSFYFTSSAMTAWAAIAVLGICCLFLVLQCFGERAQARERVLAAALTGAALLVVVHAGFRWYFREWYVPTLVPLVTLASLVVVNRLRNVLLFRAAVVAVMAMAALSAVSLGHERAVTPQYRIQEDMYDAALWVDSNTPRRARVASFNAGIIGYFSQRRTVNLDGVVDGRALEAIKTRRLTSYLDERCITHVLEFPFYVFWYKDFWNDADVPALDQLASFSTALDAQPAEIASPFTVYSYEPRGCAAGRGAGR